MKPILLITKMAEGGMETFCVGLLRAWADCDCFATLYSSYSGGERERDMPRGVERVCWNIRARNSFWRMARWLRSRPDDPCLVLSQELAVVLAILKKMHLIRNRIYYRESTDVERHYGKSFKLLMRWLWPSFSGIIEQSRVGVEATRQICRGRIPIWRVIRNIMPSVDVGPPSNLTPDSSVRIACVGSFKPMKGQEFLVDLLARDDSRNWTLTFWGGGEKRLEVERQVANSGLGGRVVFHDWVSDRSQIYEDCDVVVIPSDYEGLPNVMLEAILYGRRVSVRPTCVGACELLQEIGIGETWPWRRALEIPAGKWATARGRLAALCSPGKVADEILSFMSHKS